MHSIYFLACPICQLAVASPWLQGILKYRFVVIFLPLMNLVELDTDLKLPIPPPPMPPMDEDEKDANPPPPICPNEVKPVAMTNANFHFKNTTLLNMLVQILKSANVITHWNMIDHLCIQCSITVPLLIW